MNKRTIILLVAIFGCIALFFVFNKDNTNTLNSNEKDFGFKSTDKIDKIFITNIANREFAILTKTGKNEWRLNDKFDASTSQVDVLLETLRKLQVKKPVSKDVLDGVIKQMVIRGTKVEIYENGAISKVFYVGGNTADDLGTYFYMDKASEPYICHIPGFNGFLSSRFYTNQSAWRSKNVFKSTEEEIAEIKVQWISEPNASYVIDNSGKEPLIISGNRTFKNNTEANLNKIKSYLKSWENLCYEGFPIDLDAHKIDSIAHSKPYVILSLTDKSGKSTKLTIFLKGLKADSYQQTDDHGNPMEFELENFYAFVNDNQTEIVQIQDYVFGKVMKRTGDFMMSEKPSSK